MGTFVVRDLRFAALTGIAALTLSIGAGPPAVTAQPPSGDLIAWGMYGQLPQPTPTPLTNLGALAGKTVTALDVGPTAACAVADGEVFCWKQDPVAYSIARSNIPEPIDTTGVLTGRTVTSVSVGMSSACAVADGRVYCWGSGPLGSETYSTDVPVAVDTSGALAGKTVTSVSVSETITCVVADGGLYCWGPGGIAGSTLPRAIEAGGVFADKTVTAVTAGAYSTCALADATVYCTRNSWTFSPVGGPALGDKAVTALAAGGNMGTTACAVAEGRAYCWGAGRRGQLGNGVRAYSYEAVAVDTSGVLAGQEVSAIAVGGEHTCALANGKAFCWGDDSSGQTGSGVQPAGRSYALFPAAVTGPLSADSAAVSVLAAEGTNTCAVAAGTVYCWGMGLASLVRNGEAYQLSGLTGLTRVEDYCGIIGGRVYCWGNGRWSQESAVPVAVQGLGRGRVTDLSTGWAHACAVVKGRAYCWGSNAYGQLGNGTRKPSSKAVRVRSKGAWGPRRVSAISAGQTHTCAVAGGKAYCWGTGDLGRRSVKRSTTPVRVPLAAKRVTVISTGPAEWVYEDPQDEVETFTGRTDTCAVADGRLFCWGWNSAGQLGIGHRRSTARPTPVTGGDLKGKTVVAVSLSAEHAARTCAIAGGRAYCWGLGGLGVSGRRASTLPMAVKRLPDKRVSELAVGQNTCALVSGAVWCWAADGHALPHRVNLDSLTKPGRVVDISRHGNWGIWETT